MKKALLIIAVGLISVGLIFAAGKKEEAVGGQQIVVVTQTGRSIGGPVEDFGPEWEAATGNTVQLQQFAFGELFEKIITALETGSGDYDVLIFPADWAGDFMEQGYLEPISKEILDSIDIDDVIPLYSERLTAWGGKIYALPYDGDAHMLYYRKDLINNPEYSAEFRKKYGYPLAEPKTWKEYGDMAEFFNGREVVTDGEKAPIYGVLEAQRRNAQSYWVFLSRAAGYGKIPGNPAFFFSADDMTPQVNNPGWVKALEEYVDIAQYGPPEMINYDVADTRIHFPAGVSVFNIDWGDVGTISIDPDRSVVIGDVGFGVLPGGDQYWDYVQGRWVIPESGANTAPFIAFGGWIIGIVANSDAKEAALDFGAFMASPEMVKKLAVMPDTGINPSRFSQLEDIDPWIKAGFDRESAEDYLDAIMNTINHPNAVMDIRITGSAEYLQTLDVGVSRAVAGEVSPKEALDEVAKAWNEITDRRGRDSQLKQYRASIGLPE